MSTLNAAELAAFSVDAYDAAADLARRLPPGFVRLAELGGEAGFGGLHAAAYFNQATGELVVAYSGSGELRDLFTNLAAVTVAGDTHLNQAIAFAAEARAYAEKLAGAPLADANFTLTGHGVGGGFASLVSVATGSSAAATWRTSTDSTARSPGSGSARCRRCSARAASERTIRHCGRSASSPRTTRSSADPLNPRSAGRYAPAVIQTSSRRR